MVYMCMDGGGWEGKLFTGENRRETPVCMLKRGMML